MSSPCSPAPRISPPVDRGSSRCNKRAAPAFADPAPAGRRTPEDASDLPSSPAGPADPAYRLPLPWPTARPRPPAPLKKPVQFSRRRPPGQRIRRIGCHFHGGRLVFDRRLTTLAHDIDRPVARNRRHPRDRRRLPRIERSGAVPDLDVSFLYGLLSEILSPQDTEHDAEEFRPRGGIEPLGSSLVTLRHRGNQPDQLSWRQHSASPKSRRPWFSAWASPCRITSWAKTVHRGSDDRRWEQ